MKDVTFDFPQDPPVPKYLVREVFAKLAYIDERVKAATIGEMGDNITLTVTSAGYEQELKATLAARVRELVTAMTRVTFEPEIKTLETRDGQGGSHKDPMVELLERREVFREGDGFYAVGPVLSSLIRYIDGRLLDVAAAMGALPYRFPALISPDYMQKVRYFAAFPHSLSFCTHLRENLPDIELFSREARTENGRIVFDAELYAAPPAILSPTVCQHLYCVLSGTRLSGGGLTATAEGHCFRYEARNMNGLERVWNFTMREIIFVGTEEYVIDRLSCSRKLARPLMDDLDLSYSIMTATDPFFVNTFSEQAAYQAAFDLKYEIRAQLPYKNDTLAVGSYNRHGDFFGRTLDITNEDGSPANTACLGIGFERLALAFVAQHGTEPDKWPAAIRKGIAR